MGGLTTWSRFKHSHRIATSASRLIPFLTAIQPLHHPVFCFPFPAIPLLPRVCVCALRDTLSSVVCQDTSAIVSIDACATRLYARANLPCADRRLSINGGGLMVYSETYSRKRGLLEKWRPSTPIPRIVYISIFLFLRFFFSSFYYIVFRIAQNILLFFGYLATEYADQ